MNYKLVAIDMDGTLLSDKGITNRTKETLNAVEAKGIEVVLTTGRILSSALSYYGEIGLKGHIIACNGGIIVDGSNKPIHKKHIAKKSIKEVVSLANSMGIEARLYSKNELYRIGVETNNLNEFYDEEVKIIYLNSIGDLENIEEEFYKIIIVEKDKEKIYKIRESLGKYKDISVTSSWENNVEIMENGVSKGTALEILCDKKKISMNSVISFGDNENDLDMIEKSGLGVAMENGIDILKEKANIVTKTNNDEGVSLVLEEYILK